MPAKEFDYVGDGCPGLTVDSTPAQVGVGTGLPGTKGASDTPQLPVTTVVTPWLDFGATAGCVRTMRSS